ncbi:hypothetical protein PQG02_18670 [Nostoc sp. UHCC 0926]|uniref:hypothetical protein n=1 Tax=unclassified Nostoc TaxID=2593658 RepID=UPI002363149B|nr:hypothetical protein [Nostoc sp. UHCC 0926]WDD30768.1 hypothetical protein PQG02_18670 [Nostoc sp. UHCC 0926]
MASITCDFSYSTEEFSQSGMGTVLQQSGNGLVKKPSDLLTVLNQPVAVPPNRRGNGRLPVNELTQ